MAVRAEGIAIFEQAVLMVGANGSRECTLLRPIHVIASEAKQSIAP